MFLFVLGTQCCCLTTVVLIAIVSPLLWLHTLTQQLVSSLVHLCPVHTHTCRWVVVLSSLFVQCLATVKVVCIISSWYGPLSCPPWDMEAIIWGRLRAGLMLEKAACGAHAWEGCVWGSCWGRLHAGLMLGKAACGAHTGEGCVWAHAGEGCVRGSCWGRLRVGLMLGKAVCGAHVALSGVNIYTSTRGY